MWWVSFTYLSYSSFPSLHVVIRECILFGTHPLISTSGIYLVRGKIYFIQHVIIINSCFRIVSLKMYRFMFLQGLVAPVKAWSVLDLSIIFFFRNSGLFFKFELKTMGNATTNDFGARKISNCYSYTYWCQWFSSKIFAIIDKDIFDKNTLSTLTQF